MPGFKNGSRFSIFDAMDNAGVFEANPANVGARDREGNSAYKGPVEFPKMLYEPTGKTRITVPASAEVGSLAGQYSGQYLNEQKEMIYKIVNDAKEEAELLALGWTLHPSQSIEAGNKIRAEKGEELLAIPPISSSVRVATLETEMDKLRRELEAAQTALAKQAEREILAEAAPPPLKGNAAKHGLAV